MIVRFFQWDQPKNVSCMLLGIKKTDLVTVQHEWGIFLAQVLEENKSVEGEETVGKVIRKATPQDREMILNNKKREEELSKEIKQELRGLELPMKVVEVLTSLDSSCIVIAFMADGRIDFRELVRRLSAKYGRSVRLQQIGSRDEARRVGGYGICGREICCKKFPGSLKSISTEMARCQLISHRGSERISGICGRLMCCLAFEADQYEEILKTLPKRGDKVKTKDGKTGSVLDVNALSCHIKIVLEDGTISMICKKDLLEQNSTAKD